jgi:hypothetical protein
LLSVEVIDCGAADVVTFPGWSGRLRRVEIQTYEVPTLWNCVA